MNTAAINTSLNNTEHNGPTTTGILFTIFALIGVITVVSAILILCIKSVEKCCDKEKPKEYRFDYGTSL